jgi:CheY-like chemotaxis protein
MGATFRVRLPTMIVHPEPQREPRAHPRAEVSTPLRLGDLAGCRIMALDDDADALALARVVFESAGAQVQTFNSGPDALERLAEVRPDVLVVDLGMPAMDGFEFIHRVRGLPDPALSQIPAAALTAFARSEDRVKALHAGFQMHLAKPVDPAELVAAVSSLARRQSPRS